MSNKYDDLEKLNDLFKREVLTEEEYKKEKERILNQDRFEPKDKIQGISENTYGALIHLSLLLGFIHFFLGLIVPVVLWFSKKDSYVSIDNHGRAVFNWIFSFMIYSTILFLILFPFSMFSGFIHGFSFDFTFAFSFLTRFIPLMLLMVLNVIFIFIGALKASSGTCWNYPLSIRFFKLVNE